MFEEDADTMPGTEPGDELAEAVEWLRAEGYLSRESGEARPFESLVRSPE
jgi:hypothetical protein